MPLKTLDRYLVREIVPPLLLALAGLTFVLMLPPILSSAEQLIAKGVGWSTIVRALLTLTPQALSVTIPMALLTASSSASGASRRIGSSSRCRRAASASSG